MAEIIRALRDELENMTAAGAVNVPACLEIINQIEMEVMNK